MPVPTPVDLLVNCFELTYRDVLRAETFARIEEMNRFRFERRTALVNNVDDPADAKARGEELLGAGAIDALFFVEPHLDGALARTGLDRRKLGRAPHFSDWALVAVCLAGPDYLLHWDADVQLIEPTDWITPALELMERDPRVLAANPNWSIPGDLERQTIEVRGEFALGHGFSDQVFLARRRDLARPIYRDRSMARLRNPLAHYGHVFEARLDAHVRRSGRLRATHRRVTYEHPAQDAGRAYPPRSPLETMRRKRNLIVIGALRAIPPRLRPRSLRYM